MHSEVEAAAVLKEGYARRASADTDSNMYSSRSHCLVCVTVTTTRKVRCGVAPCSSHGDAELPCRRTDV